MNIQIVYETTGDISPFSLPFIVICLFFIVVIAYAIKVWKNSNVGAKIGLILVPVLMSIVIISQFSNFFRTKQVFENFQNGNCKTAEGRIENYEQNYRVGTMEKDDYPDRFFVDGTEFIVYGYSTYGIEYFCRQNDGSPLQEGQYVRITYENCFHENLILKVELIEKGNTE